MAEAQVAVGTPIRWQGHVGKTWHEGTVTAGPDDRGVYTITTPTHSIAWLKRDAFELVGEPSEPDAAEDLTPEQRASLREDRARQVASRVVTDAIMQVYTAAREDRERETGQRVEQDAADDLRQWAARTVEDVAVDLRQRLTQQIIDKRSLPPRESVPEPAATTPAVPE